MSDDLDAGQRLDTSAVLLREFGFLAGLGYLVEAASTDAVTWRRGGRTFFAARDWRDGYLDTGFAADGRTGDRLSFGIRQALVVTHQGQLWPEHGWQAWKGTTVEEYVAELASIVRGHLGQFLVGADDDWKAAHRLAMDEALAHWNDVRSRQWRAQAESARVNGDWPEVARAYEQLTAAGFTLTDAEAARLRYARHHSGAE